MNKDNAERYNLKIPEGTRLEFNPDGLLTTLDIPETKVDAYRAVRLEYSESLGEAYKSLTIETRLTFEELTALRIENIGVKNE